MKDIKFSDLFDFDFNTQKGFSIASKLLDIRRHAVSIAKNANDKQIENGEFATMFAENIKDWLNEIAEEAEEALDSHLEANASKREKPNPFKA